MSNGKLSRRSVLSLGAAGGAGILLGLPSLGSAGAPRKPKRVKNIIFCVADGMAMSVPTMVDHMRQLHEGKRSYWSWLLDQDFATSGLQDTRSLSSIVTDSAAAASAWGCGRHIWNGVLNEFPDGTKLRTLSSLMHEHGVKTGLVTTTTITHATPSGFAINIDNRERQADIAVQHLSNGVDVLLGGGDSFFSPEKRKDKRDVYADFVKQGYRVAKTKDELLNGPKGKTLGIFSASHLPYDVDRINTPSLMAITPTLAQMAQYAIDSLKASKNGFLLQIEGGKVDHGGHANDIAAMIYDQIAFEEAVKVAVEFALQDGQTLVIITSDHATGGPALNGAGEEYFDSTAGAKSFAGMKSSLGAVITEFGKQPTASLVQDIVKTKLGLELEAEAAGMIADAYNGKVATKPSIFYNSPQAILAMMLGNANKVTFTSGNHTNDHVLVTAVGPGRELAAGLTQNTEFFDWILAAKGIKWENPRMTFEEAAKHEAKKNKEPVAFHADECEECVDLYSRAGHC